MAKLLARMKMEYDTLERIEKLRTLSKVLNEHKDCIIKIVELGTIGDDPVFYIRPGKHVINYNSNTRYAEMIITSKGMLSYEQSVLDPGDLPRVNEWKKYCLECAMRYEITVYDELPDSEIRHAERPFIEEIVALQRKIKQVQREYLKAMKITQCMVWPNDPQTKEWLEKHPTILHDYRKWL